MNKTRIRGFINLIRPFTLFAPIIVSISIMIASLVYNEVNVNLLTAFWTTLIPASFSLAVLNGASNALNQVTDVKTDKLSKPYRPIPRGIITIREALCISLMMYILAFMLSLLVNITFSVFILLISIFTVTYSLPPRLKDSLYYNQIWVGIPRGLLGILASWSVFGNPIHPLPVTIGLIAMCFLTGGSITKDIIDSKADKKNGTSTLVNTYGVKQAALMSLPLMFFPFLFIPIFIDIGILEHYFYGLTLLAVPSILIFYLMIKEKHRVRYLENTSCWCLMYGTYFFFALSFSILTIIGKIGI